jgi:hypothetical protein
MKHPTHRFLAVFAAFLLAFFAVGASAQDARSTSGEPTVNQIYQAANSGNMDRADAMIAEVLKAHPNSAKAHYVKAEVSAREGKMDVAREELATAEKLAPGLPFAKAESVQALRNELSNKNTARSSTPATRQMGAPAEEGRPAVAPRSFPWGSVLFVVAVIAIGVMILRRRTAAIANSYPAGYGGQPGYGPGPNYPQGGAGPNYGPGYGQGYAPGYGPGYPQQPSMGSTIARGVGTGLAMGAGMVAAEELGHRMFGRDGQPHAGGFDPNVGNSPTLDQIDEGMRTNLNSDMGGNDFGMNDGGGSWDDAGGGGGDMGGGGSDWDT